MKVKFTYEKLGENLAEATREGFIHTISRDFPSLFEATAQAGVVSHEFAHVILERYYENDIEGHRKAWNGPHYAYYLDPSYMETKRYWSPRFIIKYWLPWLTITHIKIGDVIRDYHTFKFQVDGVKFV